MEGRFRIPRANAKTHIPSGRRSKGIPVVGETGPGEKNLVILPATVHAQRAHCCLVAGNQVRASSIRYRFSAASGLNPGQRLRDLNAEVSR